MTQLDRGGRSPLHYAAAENNIERARALLSQGESINLGDKEGWTPLHFAAQEQAWGVAEILLSHGAQVDPVDVYGNTPLWTAVFNSKGAGEMIALLRRYGADPYHVNNYGHTPVSAARSIANFDIAQHFVDLPPD